MADRVASGRPPQAGFEKGRPDVRRDLDRDLRFALWPQRPAWLVEPVTDLLTGRRLGDLTCEEAADALQLIASLQVVRSAVFCIPVLGWLPFSTSPAPMRDGRRSCGH